MKHISIVIPAGQVNISNIEGTYQLFSHVNSIFKKAGKSKLFDIHLVALPPGSDQPDLRYTVKSDESINEVIRTDLIIIPAVIGKPENVISNNSELIAWMRLHYQNGAEIASFCVGAFLLAATGLLKNRQCSTHWLAADALRTMFPGIDVVDDQVLTDDNGIYSSGGALCYFNLLLYLIEKFTDREIAVQIAKNYMIDINRHHQSPFAIFDTQKNHSDNVIQLAQNLLETKISERYSTAQLAGMLGIGRRTLERRFKNATGNTIAGYSQRLKIEAAKKLLESSDKNLNEVMFSVGYNDRKGFRSLFKKITGVSPLIYRSKYHKSGA